MNQIALPYREVRAGRLEVVKVGRRSLVTAEAEQQWNKSLPRLHLGSRRLAIEAE